MIEYITDHNLWVAVAIFAGSIITAITATFVTYLNLTRPLKEKQEYNRTFDNVKFIHKIIFNKELSELQSNMDIGSEQLKDLLDKINYRNFKDGKGKALISDDDELYRKLDSYLNYLESIAMVETSKRITRNDYWNYYFGILKKWKPVWLYITFPEYEWTMLTKTAIAANNKSKKIKDKVKELTQSEWEKEFKEYMLTNEIKNDGF